MTKDHRSKDPTKFSLTKHFDATTDPHRLIPQLKTETSLGLSGAPVTDLKIVKFLYAQNQTSAIFRLYGLGMNGSNNVKIYKFNIDGSSNLDIENWLAATNGESSSGARSEDVFFYYKGFIYTMAGGSSLNRYDTLEAIAFADGYQTVTYTQAVQPVHHSADDIAYFFGDHIVYALDNTSWEGAVLTLPDNMQIVGACEDGNYLAITMMTKGSLDKKIITYLWDRDSSLSTISERISFGEGSFIAQASLDGELITVMHFYIDSLYGAGRWKLLIKRARGDQGETINEVLVDTAIPVFKRVSTVKDNKLYFAASAPLNGDTRLGIWSVDSLGRLSIEFIEEQATSYDGIFRTAGLWWIAHSGNGSVTRTDDDGAYSTTLASVYESLILDEGDPDITKKLLGASVTYQPLPVAGKVVLKYRKDGGTVWTEIFTDTTDDSLEHSSNNIESTGDTLPSYGGLEFRIESYGGAVITSLRFESEIIDDGPY